MKSSGPAVEDLKRIGTNDDQPESIEELHRLVIGAAEEAALAIRNAKWKASETIGGLLEFRGERPVPGYLRNAIRAEASEIIKRECK